MYCPYCGTQLNDLEFRFCPKCGRSLEKLDEFSVNREKTENLGIRKVRLELPEEFASSKKPTYSSPIKSEHNQGDFPDPWLEDYKRQYFKEKSRPSPLAIIIAIILILLGLYMGYTGSYNAAKRYYSNKKNYYYNPHHEMLSNKVAS